MRSAAFIRRPKKDVDGLSVNLASACTIDDVCGNLDPCHGVISLHTGRIRDIGLNVEQDTPRHANITGVPYQEGAEANIAAAERLALLLAEQSRIQWLP